MGDLRSREACYYPDPGNWLIYANEKLRSESGFGLSGNFHFGVCPSAFIVMIEIFQGRIGGGKTYSAMLRMASHLAKGGHVYTNIEFSPDGLLQLVRKSFGMIVTLEQVHVLTEEQIPNFQRHISAGEMNLPVLVVIDEAQLWFNSRDWNKQSKEMLTFLTQSRKVSVDVIFITQAVSNIDKQFRVLCQYVWAFKDIQKWFPWFPIPSILKLQFDQDMQFLLKWYFVRKTKLVFDSYNTRALLRPIDFGGETVARALVQKVPSFKLSDLKLGLLKPYAWPVLLALFLVVKLYPLL